MSFSEGEELLDLHCPACKKTTKCIVTGDSVKCSECGSAGKRTVDFDVWESYIFSPPIDGSNRLRINKNWCLEPGKIPVYNPNLWSKQPEFAKCKMDDIEKNINEGILYPPILETLKSTVRVDESILDVGCAGGHYYRTLSHSLGDVNYTGCDITPEYIEFARERFPEKFWAVADARKLPFPDKSFDHVLCLFLLVHLDQEGLALVVRELTRVARKQVLFSGYFSACRVAGHQMSGELAACKSEFIYDIVDLKELEVEGWNLEADMRDAKHIIVPVEAEMMDGEVIEANGDLPVLSYVRLVKV